VKPAPITVIVNARAGNGSGSDRLRQLFAAEGLDVQVCEARDGDEIAKHAREALARNPRMIVAGGGDGTISAVAAIVAGTDVALGVLPLGTLNHFAKDLGIPTDLAAAVRIIAAVAWRRSMQAKSTDACSSTTRASGSIRGWSISASGSSSAWDAASGRRCCAPR
jgi:diacylglycerol kinase family enzyme